MQQRRRLPGVAALLPLAQPHQAPLHLAVAKAEQVGRDRIQQVVGDHHQRRPQIAAADPPTAVLQLQGAGGHHIEAGPLQLAAGEQGNKTRLLGPGLQIGRAEVAQHITKASRIEPLPLTQRRQLLEQVMGKAPRSRPQLHNPQGLLSGIAAQPIAAERHQHLGIGRRHHRVAGDVMGHLPRTPRLLAARGEILALQLPQLRLHERSEILDQGGGGLGCHGLCEGLAFTRKDSSSFQQLAEIPLHNLFYLHRVCQAPG